jgi:SPP1 family phage portal protein
MQFPDMEEGRKTGDAEFLEKNINDTVIENTLNRLRTHIYETSGSIDLKELASTERVFSIKAQMLRLENTASSAERYLQAALYKMTRLWTYWMREFEGLQISESDISWTFKRTFPRDLEAESRTLSTLATVMKLEDGLQLLGYENYKEIADRAAEREQLPEN